jgi:predicted Zn-dependent protease
MVNPKVIWGSIIVNVILIIAVILLAVLRPSKPIEEYEVEITKLETLNEVMAKDNVNLAKTVEKSNSKIKVIEGEREAMVKQLTLNEIELKRLKNKRITNGKNPPSVKHHPDSVAIEITNYLKRRTKRFE